MEGKSVRREPNRRWQFDGISLSKAEFGEWATGESLQSALIGRARTSHITVFPPGNQAGIAPQVVIAKLPTRDHHGSGELFARLAPLDLADATKYQIGSVGPLDSHHRVPSSLTVV
jgi:hypothetical protein